MLSALSIRTPMVVGGLALVAVVVGRGLGVAALVTAVVTVPLVVADVRSRFLPNVLTAPILLAGLAEVAGGALAGRGPADTGVLVGAGLVTALVLGALHLAGGLGMGDVKLGAGLAVPLALADPFAAVAGPVLSFLLAGLWALPLAMRSDRTRLAFGPFQLAAFWIVLALA